MTDQQIDEFLEMLAKSPTSARYMVRGLFAAHEAKAAPAVPQGLPAFDELDDEVIDAACTVGSLYRVDLMLAYERIRAMLAATPSAPSQPVTLTDEPALTSIVVNDACWKFVNAMPHQIPGPIWNDLKPALYAALIHYHRAILSSPSQPAQEPLTDEWISVDERLPGGEPGDAAIEFYNNDLRNPTRQVIGIYRDGVWYSGGHQFSNVSYWKPLTPAPIAALREKQGGV